MSIELLLIIHTITYSAAVSIAYWTGWWARDRQRLPRGSYGLPRRRGSNPPPPATKPQPSSGPTQPLAAQLIRYWTWKDDQTLQAFTEGRTIRGNGNGGPNTPKPQFPSVRIIGPDGETVGYRSISPPRNP